MKQRYLSLDFLRGLTIFGMVFSAIIPYGVLPAWMYHIQNPPPSHELDIAVTGISWVDLVFPIFIFCMGAAIPLSGRSRIEKGISAGSYILSTIERFFMLWFFSYAYVLLNFTTADGMWPQIFTILGFCALFPLYMVLKRKNSLPVRLAGAAAVIAIIAIGHFWFGEIISVQRRGIIIFLLAFLYLFGSLIWYFTRERLKLRANILILLFVFTYITKELGYPAATYANPQVRWWFNMEYFYFLLLLVPATYIGDILYKRVKEGNIYNNIGGKAIHLFFPLALLTVIWLCYAFYMNMGALFIIIVATAPFSILFYIACRHLPQYIEFLFVAALLLVCGTAMIPVEGGITKVPCTISYCFATCSISVLLLIFSDYLCKYIPGSFLVKVFSGAGMNPLMSYIAFDSLVMPLMKVTGLVAVYRAAYPAGCPLAGVARAAVAVLLTMWIVSLLSRRKIFWKA